MRPTLGTRTAHDGVAIRTRPESGAARTRATCARAGVARRTAGAAGRVGVPPATGATIGDMHDRLITVLLVLAIIAVLLWDVWWLRIVLGAL
jgi:hypothetical protein